MHVIEQSSRINIILCYRNMFQSYDDIYTRVSIILCFKYTALTLVDNHVRINISYCRCLPECKHLNALTTRVFYLM